MDHLPLPAGAAYPRFEFPLETDTPYDGGSFLDYPTRAGWDQARLLRGDFSERPIKETTAMLQNWLFFGLLSEFFEGDLRLDDFLRCHDGRKLITTEKLIDRLKEWKSLQLTRALAARESWLKNIEACLDRASAVVRLLGTPPYNISNELLLNFMVLGTSLSYVRKWIILPGDPNYFSIEHGAFTLQGATSLTLVTRLFNSGWCPSDVARLHSLFDVLGMYQASFLRSPGAVLHTSCTRAFCKEDSIDEGEYRKIYEKHNSGTSEGPDIQKAKSILEGGSFPLIRLKSSTESSVIRDVVAYKPGLPYTAISHAWSHGLGNPSANAMSTSQLKELQAYLSALKLKNEPNVTSATAKDDCGDIYMWIDTLCVPLDKEARKTALKRINTAYAQAQSDLVIDASLKIVSCKTSYAELALRVYSSRWMQRLWTLAEGVIAQRLCFQFLDGTVTLNELKPATQVSSDQLFTSQLHMQTFRPLMVFRRIHILPPTEQFDNIWSAATYRSTSKVADEPIILATIAGFKEDSMAKIINASEDKRMEVFLSFWDALPARILFATGKHLATPGYGWALQSLLSKGDLQAYDYSKSGRHNSTLARRVLRGLVFRRAGYLLAQEAAQLPRQFQLGSKEDAEVFTVEQEAQLQLPSSESEPPNSDPQTSKSSRSAIILSNPQLLELSSGQFAALVTVISEESGTIYCQWYTRVWISKSVKEDEQPVRNPAGIHAAFSSTSLDDSDKRRDVQPPQELGGGDRVQGRKVAEEQEWCVG